jgi:NADH-quinone oxidoreductase subunit G
MLGLPGFEQESAQEVLLEARGAEDAKLPFVREGQLSNRTAAGVDLAAVQARPASAAIYQLDGIVRRAPSLQLTADGRAARLAPEGVAA